MRLLLLHAPSCNTGGAGGGREPEPAWSSVAAVRYCTSNGMKESPLPVLLSVSVLVPVPVRPSLETNQKNSSTPCPVKARSIQVTWWVCLAEVYGVALAAGIGIAWTTPIGYFTSLSRLFIEQRYLELLGLTPIFSLQFID